LTIENLKYIIKEVIKKKKGEYCLHSKKTDKNLGCYPSKSGAEKREKQVQYFKHLKEGEEVIVPGIGKIEKEQLRKQIELKLEDLIERVRQGNLSSISKSQFDLLYVYWQSLAKEETEKIVEKLYNDPAQFNELGEWNKTEKADFLSRLGQDSEERLRKNKEKNMRKMKGAKRQSKIGLTKEELATIIREVFNKKNKKEV
jgi:hypothetical protein